MVHLALLVWIALLGVLPSSTGLAADRIYREVKRIDLSREFGTRSKWEAVVYALDSGGEGDIGDIPVAMKFCLVGGTGENTASKQKDCDRENNGSPFQLYATSFAIDGLTHFSKMHPAWRGFVIESNTSYGGSGSRILTVVWEYNPKFDDFEDKFRADHNNIGDNRFLTEGPLDGYYSLDGYYIDTEFIWTKGEIHYDDHYHRVNVYRYAPESVGSFVQVLSYITEKKYPSITDVPQRDIPVSDADKARGVIGYESVGGPSVITSEIPTIRRLLAAAYPRGLPWEASPSRK